MGIIRHGGLRQLVGGWFGWATMASLKVQISRYGYMGVCSIPATDIKVLKALEP